MAESRILTAQKGNQVFIKIEGEGTFQNSGSLKKAYQEMIRNEVTEFIFDLSQCTLLDSTFLGILLGLGLKIKAQGLGSVRVVKANNFITGLFKDLGLDRVFIFEVDSDTD